MADGMSLPHSPPHPPPSHKGRRIHHHHRHRHHRREGEGFTDSDVAAAHQLMQLSDDSDEDKRKSAKEGGSSSVADREVTSARIEAIFGRERGDRDREVLCRSGRKRFRSIAEIYAATKPIESWRMSGHNAIR